MGQYHLLVNVDKREYLNPRSLALGVKQWEHSSHPEFPMAGSLADAMYLLTMTSPARGGGDMPATEISGRWAGDRVMIVGDYTEDADLPAHYMGSDLYNQAQRGYTEIGEEVKKAFTVVYGIEWEIDDQYGVLKRRVKEAVSA